MKKKRKWLPVLLLFFALIFMEQPVQAEVTGADVTSVLPETGSGTMLFLELVGIEFIILSKRKGE